MFRGDGLRTRYHNALYLTIYAIFITIVIITFAHVFYKLTYDMPDTFSEYLKVYLPAIVSIALMGAINIVAKPSFQDFRKEHQTHSKNIKKAIEKFTSTLCVNYRRINFNYTIEAVLNYNCVLEESSVNCSHIFEHFKKSRMKEIHDRFVETGSEHGVVGEYNNFVRKVAPLLDNKIEEEIKNAFQDILFKPQRHAKEYCRKDVIFKFIWGSYVNEGKVDDFEIVTEIQGDIVQFYPSIDKEYYWMVKQKHDNINGDKEIIEKFVKDIIIEFKADLCQVYNKKQEIDDLIIELKSELESIAGNIEYNDIRGKCKKCPNMILGGSS